MPTPDELEAAADRLRDCASTGRTKAQALATFIDTLVTTGNDDSVWKGAYPDQAATEMRGDRSGLERAAALLREDAAAWDRKAAQLDDQAAGLRVDQKKAAAGAGHHAGGPR